jgi:putative Holliday junction resolvase
LKFFIWGLWLDGAIVAATIPRVSVLGIDLGARRIGVAWSDSGLVATPHSVLRNEGDVVARVATLARELDAELVVVGLPRQRHASRGEQKYRDFAEALRQKTCKAVVLWDEGLSTVEAAERLRQSGRSRREAQKDIDMYAAAVILQSYLDDSARADGGRPA